MYYSWNGNTRLEKKKSRFQKQLLGRWRINNLNSQLQYQTLVIPLTRQLCYAELKLITSNTGSLFFNHDMYVCGVCIPMQCYYIQFLKSRKSSYHRHIQADIQSAGVGLSLACDWNKNKQLRKTPFIKKVMMMRHNYVINIINHFTTLLPTTVFYYLNHSIQCFFDIWRSNEYLTNFRCDNFRKMQETIYVSEEVFALVLKNSMLYHTKWEGKKNNISKNMHITMGCAAADAKEYIRVCHFELFSWNDDGLLFLSLTLIKGIKSFVRLCPLEIIRGPCN